MFECKLCFLFTTIFIITNLHKLEKSGEDKGKDVLVIAIDDILGRRLDLHLDALLVHDLEDLIGDTDLLHTHLARALLDGEGLVRQHLEELEEHRRVLLERVDDVLHTDVAAHPQLLVHPAREDLTLEYKPFGILAHFFLVDLKG